MRQHRGRKKVKQPDVRELSPGEQQYLCSLNLKRIAPEVWREVKRNGAKTWREKRKQVESANTEALLKNDSTKER